MWLLKFLSEWFWSPSIWLIPGKTWEDMKSTDSYTLPDIKDTYVATLYLTGVFMVLRFILTHCLFKPFGKWCGIPDTKRLLPLKNTLLEEVYYTIGEKPSKATVKEVSTKLKWSERQVERWLRDRRSINKATKLSKFCDSCWQLAYYLVFSCLGLCIMWDKKWLWDIRHCWYGYPFQHLTNDIWWYYMIPLGFYTSSILTYFIQPKRKDYLVMFLHHVVTIVLIVLSWSVNLVRVGSLVILVHECADIPLQFTKLFMYLKKSNLGNISFVSFFLLWIVTRLGFYPFWIIKSCLFQAHLIVNAMCFMYYIFNGLLIMLLCFHVFWTYFIVRLIFKQLSHNKSVLRDTRSDTESCLTDSDSEQSEEDKKDL